MAEACLVQGQCGRACTPLRVLSRRSHCPGLSKIAANNHPSGALHQLHVPRSGDAGDDPCMEDACTQMVLFMYAAWRHVKTTQTEPCNACRSVSEVGD
jgi:hypothetical protein